MRYSRQIALPGFGPEGQRRLGEGRVLIVGAGGLGSPAALYLTAAGTGVVGLVDFDEVDETNLQRQILYATGDVGRSKLAVARDRLHAVNPDVTIELHEERLSADNALRLVEAYDVVIDGTDNFATRYLVNDACVMTGTPNVYGSVARFEGQASVFATPDGPCYRCLHPDPPPPGLIQNCAEGGVLGVLPGIIGTIQATEAIKLLTGLGDPLIGRVFLYDALKMRTREIVLPRDPDCPACGDSPTIRTLSDEGQTATCNSGKEVPEMKVEELDEWRKSGRPHLLIDVREPSEHAINRIDGAILIPLRSLQASLSRIPKDQPVVIHCKSGGRSAIATAILKVLGYDARNLSGGIQAWESRIANSSR
jgi:sulfur-carrier protein adenylyltransferase/sulfurtransferase